MHEELTLARIPMMPEDLSASRARYAFAKYTPVAFAIVLVGLVSFTQPETPWFMFLPLLVVPASVYVYMAQFKRVASLDGCLVISDAEREVHVPRSELVRITRTWGRNPPTVLLVFRNATPVGRRVLFIPAEREPFPRSRDGGVVDRLRRLSRDHAAAPCSHGPEPRPL